MAVGGYEVAAGVLLGTFTADALGARWEGAPPTSRTGGTERLALSLRAPVLTYTDDTQLTLALAEHLRATPEVDPQGLADVFLDHVEEHRGYGGGMRRLLAVWRSGTPVEQAATAIFPDGSCGNGSAMRAAPVGVVHAGDAARRAEVAARQARITHAHPIGVEAAQVQAHAVALAATRRSFDRRTIEELASGCATAEMGAGLEAASREPRPSDATDFAEVADRLGHEVLAHRSLPAALWIAAVAESFRDGMGIALALGGDADTIAAMAGAILGAAGGADAIPRAWVARLEGGARGRPYAERLARELSTGPRQEAPPRPSK
jgi:poly(ADP-ribose) glycohydrolase ARH3